MNHQTHTRHLRHHGAARDTLFIVLVLGLIGWGLFYVIRLFGTATEQYTTGMIQAHNMAESVACQGNLRAIYQAMMISLTTEGTLPQTKQELLQWCGGNKTFRCPDPNGGEYIYAPPKHLDYPEPRIVAFEPNAVHDGHFHVLLTDGSITAVPEEYLGKLLKK